jgi:hypothetical protein
MRSLPTRTGNRSRDEKESFIQVRALLAISLLSLSVFGLLAAPVPTGKPSNYPAWWFARGVIAQTTPTNASPSWPTNYPASDDYAVINEGQLKNFASQAYNELQAQAPTYVWSTTQGTNLTSMVSGWSTPATNEDDYQAINLGQLKTVAQPFYDVLNEMSYSSAYPWSNVNADDYSVANIGQVKNVLSFDVGYASDGDGVPDWWEMRYFGQVGLNATNSPDGNGLTLLQDYQQGNNPNDYYNQGGTNTAPVMTIISGNSQTGTSAQFLTNPLVVQVKNASGTALTNAPVIFSVPGENGLISTSSSGTPQPVGYLQVTTDGSGYAQVYFQEPNAASFTSTINVSASLSQTNFIATTAADTGSPAAPSNGAVCPGPTAGEIDLSWVNNADNATYIVIQQSTDNVTWTTTATLTDPTITTYAVMGLTQGQIYYFRIAAGN